ncbi:EamA family transporter [Microbacterium sp. 179-I 3D2 NHS]|uniref:EamA family transporter n=1 Tax=Microbacterium sp. 179-I 3D2 NHS TaxID=3235178 RepID=UPI00399EEEE1
MISVLLGLVSAVGYGAADFLGGIAARRIIAMLVTAVAALAGVAALTLAAPIDGGVWHLETTLVGFATGVTSCLGIWLLYSAYARGPMTTLAPVVAIVSTVVPMSAGLLSGETFSPLGWTALVIGLVAIALVSRPGAGERTRAHRVDVIKAAVAGAFLGVLYIHLDSAPLDAGLTPLTANRISCAVLAFAIAGVLAWRSRGVHPVDVGGGGAADAVGGVVRDAGGGGVMTVTATRVDTRRSVVIAAAVAIACASGLLDASANTLFLVGLSFGDLSVLSVVSGFYPAVTILLALLFLGERPSRLQTMGIVLALAAMLGMSMA